MNILQKAKNTFDKTDLKEHPITLCCLKINQLPDIQKKHGDRAASSLVNRFLSTLVSVAREDDLVGCFEEDSGKKVFTLLLMDLDVNRVDNVINRLNSAIQKNLLVLKMPCSVSIGHDSTKHGRENQQFEKLLNTTLNSLFDMKDNRDASKLDWSEHINKAA